MQAFWVKLVELLLCVRPAWDKSRHGRDSKAIGVKAAARLHYSFFSSSSLKSHSCEETRMVAVQSLTAR